MFKLKLYIIIVTISNLMNRRRNVNWVVKLMIKKELVNGAIWNTFGSMFYLGIFFLTNIIVGRWGKNFVSSSLYTNPMRFVNPFAAFALYGMRSFQVSDSNSKYKDKEYILSRYVTTGLAFFVCIIMAVIEGYSGVEFAIIFVFLLYISANNDNTDTCNIYLCSFYYCICRI